MERIIFRQFARLLVCLAAVAAGPAAHAADVPPDPKALEFFETRIRPVLVDQCYKCHSAKSEKLRGDLLVDTRAGLLKGGASKKPSINPGEPEKSPLIHAIRGDDEDLVMPPKGDGLSKRQIADFVEWIKMGAPDPRMETVKSPYATPAAESHEAKSWWAFRPITHPPVPPIDNPQSAIGNPVDAFLAVDQQKKGLTPVAPADPRTLIRRATYDLTGLPPTPADVDAFVADRSPDAYEKVLDRLLASPAYGERWARHWLDLVRYSDTAGESADYPVPQAYQYRNYVISAFNADKPYDRFLTEQVAGDLLPASSDDQRRDNLVATGFLSISRRFSVQPESVMHLTYEDSIDMLGKSVLGLSVSCARCHDHKFDPIPSADYYALYGILASTKYPYPGSEETQFQKDMVVLAMAPDLAARYKAHTARVVELNKQAAQLRRDERKAPDEASKKPIREAIEANKKQLKAAMAQAPDVPAAYAVQDRDEPADAFVQLRGEPYNRGPTVRRGFLTVLGGQKLPEQYKGSGRLELARWLTDPANPLTARVLVNRLWQHHFGQGIVKTPSDFGRRGAAPTHPELLDYLATRFVDGGWSIKAMHKLIMTSAAYRRGDAADPKNVERDASNDNLWRFDRRRLDAEQIRDAMLFVSGDLDPTIPAGHPFPPMSKWGWTQHNPFSAVYETRHRSIYLMQQRIKKHPFLALFDGADPNSSTAQRTGSTTPLQALYMMNDKFVFDQSERFATTLTERHPDLASRVSAAIAMCYGRPADVPEEVAAALQFIDAYRARLAATPRHPADLERPALAAYLRVVLCSNEFFYVD